MKARVSTLITDLDNTLYDWVAIWHSAFSAMMQEVHQQSGVELDALLADARRVHQYHGTTEYTLLLQEMEVLNKLHPNEDIAVVYRSAIDAYAKAREARMQLYPTVRETLEAIRADSCLVVGATESMAYYSNYRVRRLGLDGLLDYLYSSPDHDFPRGVTREALRSRPSSDYKLTSTEHRHTPRGALKPNASILNAIIQDLAAEPEHVVYVGDSLMKDIHMANQVGIPSALAAYGGVHDSDEYELLRAVSHWTDEDVERERKLLEDAGDITPTVCLEASFAELLHHFDFMGG